MRKVYLKVNHEFVDGQGTIACGMGSYNVPTVNVEFTNWDGLSKYATVKNSKGQNATLIVLGLDKLVPETTNTYEFALPAEALDEEGLLSISFTGYTVNGEGAEATIGELVNTATAYLRVLPSDAEFDDNSITPSAQQQLQAQIDTLMTNYMALAERVAEAAQYADNARIQANNSATSATQSRSYAKGDTETRTGEETDNSYYYKEEAKTYRNGARAIYDSLDGGYIAMGACEFDDLPALSDTSVGFMYNVTDAFTTTSDFEIGAGEEIEAGASVYKTNNNKWAIMYTNIAAMQNDIADLQSDVSTIDGEIVDINTALGTLDSEKVDKVTGKQLSTEDFTSTLLSKLNGIEAQANKTIVDTTLNGSSRNAVANSAVVGGLNGKSNTLLVESRVATGYDLESFTSSGYGQTKYGWIIRNMNIEKAGYTPWGILGIYPDTDDFLICHFYLNGNLANVKAFNTINASIPNAVRIKILYEKN